MRTLLFVLAGVGVAYAIAQFFGKKKKAAADEKNAREARINSANVTNDITGVGKGGVIKVPPFGNQKTAVETYVKTRHRYNADGESWYELVCDHAGRELLLEWSREGSKVYITAGYDDENPKLEAIGLNEDKLIEFDEAEKGQFEWDGTTWHLSEATERKYYENDGNEAEGLYAWEFEDDDASRYITIEKWEGDRKFYVYHQCLVPTDEVVVYDAGGV